MTYVFALGGQDYLSDIAHDGFHQRARPPSFWKTRKINFKPVDNKHKEVVPIQVPVGAKWPLGHADKKKVVGNILGNSLDYQYC